jgi:B12-binding domain/radical SAM domain protein of rhizo-twelve system
MKVALINPNWSFERSIYFGCRSWHLPLELGYTQALLQRRRNTVLLIDAQREKLAEDAVRARLKEFGPDMTVITTAPTYLFWRCPPPELRVPQALAAAIRADAGILVAVGPHGSTTPETVLRKLDADIVVMGECEEAIAELTRRPRELTEGVCFWQDGRAVVNGSPRAADFAALPALRWPDAWIAGHDHHHHRFDLTPRAPGAEVETSRGCPYHCSFCAKENFRDAYRRRPVEVVMEEIEGLIGQGAEYIYFIDEIFLPNRPLLEALAALEKPIRFGVQTRIDLWRPDTLALLGRAGCVSIEAGIESLTDEGRQRLDKDCRIGLAQLTDLLIEAKKHVAFVQANLIEMPEDDDDTVQRWRETVQSQGIWANDPVPLFPYPGSPQYRKLWGLPDGDAWERAVDYYLRQFAEFSDIQEEMPAPLRELERHVS